jgi:hypothetical protein
MVQLKISFMDRIAFRLWQQDVANSLAFQWGLWFLVCGFSSFFGAEFAVNAALAGAAVAIPSTALGAWMGVRLWLGKVSPFGVFIGGIVKTLLSTVLIGAAFAALQELGWAWQGFLAGLISMVLSPVVFGLVFSQRS